VNGHVTILGVDFFSGSVHAAVETIRQGGLLVAPAGPGLAHNLVEDAAYTKALAAADVVLPDSGLMVLLWNYWARSGGARLRRVSGLEFLDCHLRDAKARGQLADSFWVMPSVEEKTGNFKWLANDLGVTIPDGSAYIAPMYPVSGPVEDPQLLEAVRASQCSTVFLNIGGGVQERVGHYLRQNLDPCPAILCCGAAIAFLAGGQARIPKWADRLKLGWLMRCLDNPASFIPRYWKAKSLVSLMLRHRERHPAPSS